MEPVRRVLEGVDDSGGLSFRFMGSGSVTILGTWYTGIRAYTVVASGNTTGVYRNVNTAPRGGGGPNDSIDAV